MTSIESTKPRRLSPSKLAPKLLCRAYEPSEFPKGEKGDRWRWKHSDESKYVMKHLLQARFQILDLEKPANGGRIDITAKAPDGRIVGVEVKAHQGEIREVDKIQAALYFSPQLEAVGVANRRKLEMLSAEYVQEVRVAAHITQELLDTQPELARVSFTPHPDVCRACANCLCLYPNNRSVRMRLGR